MEFLATIIQILCAVFLIWFIIYSNRLREQLAKERSEHKKDIKELHEYQTGLKNTNKAYKWANTKHKETIESLEKEIEEKEVIRKKMIKELALLQDYNINQGKIIDESKVVVEFLVTKAKKSEMEAAKATAKEYYRM